MVQMLQPVSDLLRSCLRCTCRCHQEFHRFTHPAAMPVMFSRRTITIEMRNRQRIQQHMRGRGVVGKASLAEQYQARLFSQRSTTFAQQPRDVVLRKVFLGSKNWAARKLAE